MCVTNVVQWLYWRWTKVLQDSPARENAGIVSKFYIQTEVTYVSSGFCNNIFSTSYYEDDTDQTSGTRRSEIGKGM